MAVVTRASHAVQQVIGWTSFRQAALMLACFIITKIPEVLEYWLSELIKIDDDRSAFNSAFAFIMVLIASSMRSRCLKADEQWETRTNVLPLDVYFVHQFSSPWLRMLWVVMVVILPPVWIRDTIAREWLKLFTHLDGLFMMLAIFLCGVWPLPRGPSRVQKAIEDFMTGLRQRVPIKE